MSLVTGQVIPLHYPSDSVTATTYSIPADLGFLIANPSALATWTLPSLSNIVEGCCLWVRNISAYNIALTAGAGNTISSGSSYTLGAGETAFLTTVGTTDWKIVSVFPSGGRLVQTTSSSSTDNAIARWDGTNGNAIQNSLAVVDDSGNITTSGTFGTASAPLRLTRAVVTQATSNTTAVTANGNCGKITMFGNLTTAAGGTSSAFTVNNSACTATSAVEARVTNYTGTYSTNGIPLAVVSAISAGSFALQISNVHGTNALSGTCTIDFVLV